MLKNRFGVLLCLGIISLIYVSDTWSQDDNLTLIAVYPKDFPPVYTVSKNGVPTGFGFEFTEEVAKRAGLNIEYRSVPTWTDADKALINGEADLIPNMGITNERRKLMSFSRPFHEIPVSIIVHRDNQDIYGFTDLTGKLVGVVTTNIAVSLLQDDKYIYKKEYASLNDLFLALLEKKIDAAVYPEPNFKHLALRAEIPGLVKTVGEPLVVVPRAIAVRKGNANLLEKLNPAITEVLQSESYQRMLNRWFPPPAPFWTSQRVAMLVLVLFVGAALLWQMYRIVFLRKLNSKLAIANNFNTAVLDAALEGILTLDDNNRIDSVNAAGETMLNMNHQELVNTPVSWLLSGPDAQALMEAIEKYRAAPANQRRWNSRQRWECTARRMNGQLFPVQVSALPMDIGGELQYVLVLHDESHVQQIEQRVQFLLHHDPLTGLLNQEGIRSILDDYIAQSATLPFACICVGLQRLTYINVTYGRQVGDEVLLQTSSNLRQIIENYGKHMKAIARIGGERFLIVVSEVSAEEVLGLVERISDKFQEYHIQLADRNEAIRVDAQFGVACYPKHGISSEELIYHSEVAFYSARDHSFSAVHIYDSRESQEHSSIEHALQRVKSALSDDRISLYFQPIQNLSTGKILHFEALLRMHEPDGSLIMPADIIPHAERYGLITRIDYRVMQLAITYLASLQENYPNVSLSVNLSPVHLGDDRIISWFSKIFHDSPELAKSLIFEITETATLQNMANAKQFMIELRDFGCRFALDDFGVGFTSFSQLRNLPVDIVKIDGIFVRKLPRNPDDQALVRTLTDVAHSMGKEVVAEFVEDRVTLELLKEYGVDYAQGYYIGKPGPDLIINNEMSEQFSRLRLI
ncbi:MAG: EAL domain-containing protein [Gammaproteobacteria bacterium]|jgi:diguanylate cyclase (GGDEF)-like protein/PAS domain S-box-containing protein